MLHRILALVDGSASAWNQRNGLAAAILARAVLESVAVWVKITKDLEGHISHGAFDSYDRLLAQIYFGARTEWSPGSTKGNKPALQPMHVNDGLKALEKEHPGVARIYDELCEVAHPNGESFFAISDWHDVDSVSLDPAASNGELFGKLLAAIRLDITRDYLARWEKDLAPTTGRLWRKANNLPAD